MHTSKTHQVISRAYLDILEVYLNQFKEAYKMLCTGKFDLLSSAIKIHYERAQDS